MNPIITSRQNRVIKELTKLHTAKERRKQNRFLVEGFHMIEEAEQAGCLKEVYLLTDTQWDHDIKCTYCSREVMNKLSLQQSDAKAIGLCSFPEMNNRSNRILLLEDIQDPGNMGTLLRSAYAFGFTKIICSPGCVDVLNPKVLQASQGAFFHIEIQTAELSDRIQSLKKEGFRILGTGLHGNTSPLEQVDPSQRYALLLGNEGKGVSTSLLSQCDSTIKIEMDAFESLNVAIAGAIIMYSCRQKEKKEL